MLVPVGERRKFLLRKTPAPRFFLLLFHSFGFLYSPPHTHVLNLRPAKLETKMDDQWCAPGDQGIVKSPGKYLCGFPP